jgi:hypothetical protein
MSGNGSGSTSAGRAVRGPIFGPLPARGSEARAGRASDPDTFARVVRDALDQTTEIVRDAAAIGAIEAKRAARELGPRIARRVAFGGAAAGAGLTSFVLLSIAIFMALGGPIPSVAWRLFVFAIAFGIGAGACARAAARRATPTADEEVHFVGQPGASAEEPRGQAQRGDGAPAAPRPSPPAH